MNTVLDIVGRHEKVAFFGVKGEGETVTYHRMQGFTELSTSKNPKEYSRQYVDEEFERTDVVGYSTSISYNFDEVAGNPIHDEFVLIEEEEVVGANAIRDILIVDLSKAGDTEGTFSATMRSFSVIPDASGDSTDAYTHSGTLRANGEKVFGTATTTDGWKTAVFTANEE